MTYSLGQEIDCLLNIPDCDLCDKIVTRYLKPQIHENTCLILYGVDNIGISAFNIISEYNIKVNYFCDDNPIFKGMKLNDIPTFKGTNSGDIPILDFKELKELYSENKNIVVLVTCFYYSILKKRLGEIGVQRVLYYPELLARKVNKEELNKGELMQLFEVLGDEKSKFIAKTVINVMLTGNIRLMSKLKEDNQYFDKDIIKLTDKEVFIDVGAFDGDTIKQFIEHTSGKFTKIYAFEADKYNFQNLKMNSMCNNDSNILLINKGIFNQNTTISFLTSPAGKTGSRITEFGNDVVEVVCLDEYLKPSNDIPTFIKMDIEGAEMEALLGAKHIIQNYKPKLAIAVYHNLEDLWKIPLLIKNIQPDYDIYLRHYTDCQYDTVCYAIPK